MAGGSEIRIGPEGITLKTLQGIYYHATQHQFKKGEHVEHNVLQHTHDYSHQIQLTDSMGNPLGKDVPYCIYVQELDQEFHGRTNHQGKTKRIFTKATDHVQVKTGREARDYLLKKGIKV